VEPVGAPLPELDPLGPDPISAPVWRPAHLTVREAGLSLGIAPPELSPIGHPVTLGAGPRAKMATPLARRQVDLGISGPFDIADHAYLATQLEPPEVKPGSAQTIQGLGVPALELGHRVGDEIVDVEARCHVGLAAVGQIYDSSFAQGLADVGLDGGS
jgi:hypothetical protein